jgi:23S rRNA (adenine2503-C2)-methyltransferase
MIHRLGDEKVKFNLALSLHAAEDIKRNEIMPINETNHLGALMEALDHYYKMTKGRISFEYIALKGFNDTMEDADHLVKLCRGQFPLRSMSLNITRCQAFLFKNQMKTRWTALPKESETKAS